MPRKQSTESNGKKKRSKKSKKSKKHEMDEERCSTPVLWEPLPGAKPNFPKNARSKSLYFYGTLLPDEVKVIRERISQFGGDSTVLFDRHACIPSPLTPMAILPMECVDSESIRMPDTFDFEAFKRRVEGVDADLFGDDPKECLWDVAKMINPSNPPFMCRVIRTSSAMDPAFNISYPDGIHGAITVVTPDPGFEVKAYKKVEKLRRESVCESVHLHSPGVYRFAERQVGAKGQFKQPVSLLQLCQADTDYSSAPHRHLFKGNTWSSDGIKVALVFYHLCDRWETIAKDSACMNFLQSHPLIEFDNAVRSKPEPKPKAKPKRKADESPERKPKASKKKKPLKGDESEDIENTENEGEEQEDDHSFADTESSSSRSGSEQGESGDSGEETDLDEPLMNSKASTARKNKASVNAPKTLSEKRARAAAAAASSSSSSSSASSKPNGTINTKATPLPKPPAAAAAAAPQPMETDTKDVYVEIMEPIKPMKVEQVKPKDASILYCVDTHDPHREHIMLNVAKELSAEHAESIEAHTNSFITMVCGPNPDDGTVKFACRSWSAKYRRKRNPDTKEEEVSAVYVNRTSGQNYIRHILFVSNEPDSKAVYQSFLSSCSHLLQKQGVQKLSDNWITTHMPSLTVL